MARQRQYSHNDHDRENRTPKKDQYARRISMKCINMLINLNEEKEEDNVVDDKKKRVNSATNVLFLLSVWVVCAWFLLLFFFILCVRFKSVNSAHFYYTLIVVTGVETDILRNQTWYAVCNGSNQQQLQQQISLLISLPADFWALQLLAGWLDGCLPACLLLQFFFSFISRAYRSKMETELISWWLWINRKKKYTQNTHCTNDHHDGKEEEEEMSFAHSSKSTHIEHIIHTLLSIHIFNVNFYFIGSKCSFALWFNSFFCAQLTISVSWNVCI